MKTTYCEEQRKNYEDNLIKMVKSGTTMREIMKNFNIETILALKSEYKDALVNELRNKIENEFETMETGFYKATIDVKYEVIFDSNDIEKAAEQFDELTHEWDLSDLLCNHFGSFSEEVEFADSIVYAQATKALTIEDKE